MSTVAASSIPAGWYDDPAGSDEARWWDGAAWTAQLRPKTPIRATIIPTPPVTPIAPTNDYVPFQSNRSRVSPTATPRGISHTRSSWWIAIQPIWSSVPQVVIFALFTALGNGPGLQLVVGLAGFSLISWIIVVRLAFADRSALLAGGNQSAASAWWILLSPLAYLIARGLHVRNWDSSAWGALIWYIGASILAPILCVVGYFAALGILP